MNFSFIRRAALCLAALIPLAAMPAMADAIDGDWCLLDQHLNIKGPQITFRGAKPGQGQYTRHSFDYVVPSGEKDAGLRLTMVLVSEETMRLVRSRDGKSGDPEVWRRCSMQTSMLQPLRATGAGQFAQ